MNDDHNISSFFQITTSRDELNTDQTQVRLSKQIHCHEDRFEKNVTNIDQTTEQRFKVLKLILITFTQHCFEGLYI